MSELENQPWAEFAERLAEELLQHGATEAVLVTRNTDEDRVVTNYYNCNYEKRWILLGHLFTDIMIEAVEVNAELIREILEGELEDE